MKVVILAGGLGTRLAEETGVIPKPMVEIGGYPILWHIMKIYSHYGLNEFIVCLGYKGYCIKEYFLNYRAHSNDLTINTGTGDLEFHCNRSEKWIISLIETGARTLTGGRLKRVREYVQDEDFCMTYGDGVANVNIAELLKYHEAQGRLATVTSVKPPGRFGALDIRDGKVTRFLEKPSGDQGAINGGFFVLSPKVLDLIGELSDDLPVDHRQQQRTVIGGDEHVPDGLHEVVRLGEQAVLVLAHAHMQFVEGP